MSTINQVANAFAAGHAAKCGNAVTDGGNYWLHGNRIAQFNGGRTGVTIDWCGYYTPTTANHINRVLDACGINVRVSYAKARDNQVQTTTFFS